MIIDWQETCAKCKDGELYPTYCEYFGEPNGCNSPTYGKHPPIDNVAAMREALIKADAAFRLISKSAWFIDANFSETKELMEAGNAIAVALSATKGVNK